MPLPGPHIIIGLGNPGAEYRATRHNAGFDVIDALAAELGVNYWKIASNAAVGEARLKGEKIILIKPQTYMNLSGGSVKGLAGRYGFDAGDMLVIHDELDLPAGTIRLKLGGGHAGHRGLRSLHQAMGADYARVRIGIGRPPGRMPADAFVLRKMKGQELEEFAVTIAQAVPVVRMAIVEGIRAAMNVYNQSEKESVREERAYEKGAVRPDRRGAIPVAQHGVTPVVEGRETILAAETAETETQQVKQDGGYQ